MSDRSEETDASPELPPGFPECPVSYALGLLNGKWKLQIVHYVNMNKTIRFNSLRRKLEGISNLMLARSLQEMEIDKIINRHQYNEMPPRVEYSLTELGKAVIPTIDQLGKWGEEVWYAKKKLCHGEGQHPINGLPPRQDHHKPVQP
jgi:DNA-binding HxlR family transcriptional regulator